LHKKILAGLQEKEKVEIPDTFFRSFARFVAEIIFTFEERQKCLKIQSLNF
jgi:hypothetical protein